MGRGMLALLLGLLMSATALAQESGRRIVRLDGTWQVEQGGMDAAPQTYGHSIPVPGLIDMAQPAFAEVGKKSGLRQAFWYRRTFKVDGAIPEFATLKIHKARYGTRVFLNGQLVGDHLPCFTPALLDVKRFLKGEGQENELVIRIGADRDSMPKDMPAGWDFEKYLFIPGIYDSVELILSGGPRIVNVQTVPDLPNQRVRVVAELLGGSDGQEATYTAHLDEWRGGKRVISANATPIKVAAGKVEKIDFALPIPQMRVWSPEDPFLYVLTLSTGGDEAKVRFGMRSFTFDNKTRMALLNGKPYPMLGTNVTAYRFFEDALRGDKPWRAEWVRRLHQAFKSMQWNCIRYCIGFPPEIWYDIADEEGFLIQDEFPIWLLNPNSNPPPPEQPKAEKIIPEYIEWMRERWNHPCVVIWDGQNESETNETGKAISAVRGLDLSNRPWENGWAEPNSANDCIESHPYLFIRTFFGPKPFFLRDMPTISGQPHLTEAQKKLNVAVIINEYDWLWLDRDGNPTSLTGKVYESILGKNSTVEQRRMLRARYVAALTEFWRAHRGAAAIMHFCGLGYSRPGDKPRPEGGATSDDFTDIEKLTFEPLFKEYVGEAFNPLGLMLDYWADTVDPGSQSTMKVYIVNDRPAAYRGAVRLLVLRSGQRISAQSQPCEVQGIGRQILEFRQVLPTIPGNYTIVAELTDVTGKRIRSLRDVKVKGAAGQ